MQSLEGFGLRVGQLPEDPARGRCVFAARSFRAGEVLLSERPAAAVLRWDQWAKRCARCFDEISGAKAPACHHCNLMLYCSEACQRDHWQSQHKAECAALRRLRARGLEGLDLTDALLAVRGLGCARQVQEGEAPDSGVAPLAPSLQDLFDMVSPKLRPRSKGKQASQGSGSARAAPARAQKARAAEELDPKEATEEGWQDGRHRRIAAVLAGEGAASSEDAALAMLLRFEPGTFHIHGADCVAFAYGLFPHAALTNHACAPNCVATFAVSARTPGTRTASGRGGAVLELRALEDIRCGDELVHCYVDIAWPVWSRQQRLKHGYDFVCRCSRCEGPWDRDLQLCGTPRGGHILGDGAACLMGGPTIDKATKAAVSEIRGEFMRKGGLPMAVPDKVRDMDLVQSATEEMCMLANN